MTPGPRNSITDIPGITVGHASNSVLKSGVTVLTAADRFIAGVHIMGGAPGTRETDLLAPDKLVERVDALVLSGGSAFGLAAADGVMAGLRRAGRGFQVNGRLVPIVPAAILYDLDAGGDHDWSDNPYPTLGRKALQGAGVDAAMGSVGAGTGAIAGQLKGGIGTASAVLEDGTTVGALVAANPVGGVVCPDTGRFWAAPFEEADEFGARGVPKRAALATKVPLVGAATTIALVATDATLTKAGATRLATAAHDGLARAILPAHTPFDGDLVFAAATGARPAPDPMGLALLGHAAATCLSRAIARAVFHATPAIGDPVPCWQDRFG
ncbi:Peptidase family S58 [Rhodobacteraceae bacterium THAF1]|uniref:P1 family peptidase n=1 Tax=Palleronia sp. THAF1 TaxID=2587842 RepID=UPI000F3D1F8C|nr:P1 family peptidase [Palleronia sp. THAF1]QFU07478.1 Peptidase family S58 [Palleronia sp. THAF1]VDC20414.1 Peptidase family S58 [Rhodobacteraceae bacterium THAF1]